jgi:hypothetical protein
MGVVASTPLKKMPDGRTYFVDYDGGKVFVKEPAAPSPTPPQPSPVSVSIKFDEELDFERFARLIEY